jgi:phosphonate transport system substrate-binding protein
VIKKIIGILLVTLLVSEAFAKDQLVFGVPPWRKPEALYEIHKPIIEALEQQLGIKLVFHVSSDYESLIHKVQSELVDIVAFSPNLYVQAKQRIPLLRYLATVNKRSKQGGLVDNYYSVILGLKSRNIDVLADLKGKRFAFTDYQSTSGYVYPNMVLMQQGIDPKTFFSDIFMLKKHGKVLEALVQEKVEGGATSNELLQELRENHGDIVNVLSQTKPIPYDAYATAPHVDPVLAARIQQVLLNIRLSDADYQRARFKKNQPMAFSLKSDAFYDSIREAANFSISSQREIK